MLRVSDAQTATTQVRRAGARPPGPLDHAAHDPARAPGAARAAARRPADGARRSSPTSCASELFGVDTPVRIVAAVVLVILGWTLARDLGRWVEPALFRRVDPGTAGTVSFLIRLSFLAIAGLVRAAHRRARAAHARRRRCDHRGRLRPRRPADAGQPDRRRGADRRAPVPHRRPRAAAGRRAGRPDRGHRRLARPALRHARPGRGLDHGPQQRRAHLGGRPAARARRRRPARAAAPRRQAVGGPDPARERREDAGAPEPHISLEEVDSDEVIVRIAATPESDADGPRLADEVLSAIASVTREGDTDERMAARRERDGDRDGADRAPGSTRPAVSAPPPAA